MGIGDWAQSPNPQFRNLINYNIYYNFRQKIFFYFLINKHNIINKYLIFLK